MKISNTQPIISNVYNRDENKQNDVDFSNDIGTNPDDKKYKPSESVTSASYTISSFQKAVAESSINHSVINPADWITQSDKDLVKKMTGLTVKDGKYYDPEGNIVQQTKEAQQANDLIESMYEIHDNSVINNGTISSGFMKSVNASDLQTYIDTYANRANSPEIDSKLLKAAMDALG